MKNCARRSIVAWLVGAAACVCAGCSSTREIPKITAQVEVFLHAAQSVPDEPSFPGTKTFVGGSRLDKTFWSERDTIRVYWRAAGTSSPLGAGQPFHCYRYSPSVSTFAAQMDAMAPGAYDYYAAFRSPPP